MLEDLDLRAQGEIAHWLKLRFSYMAEELLRDIFREAVELWRLTAFDRYSDGEVSCTFRLYRCLKKAIEAGGAKYTFADASLDGLQPTTEMLDGLTDPSHAPRPDLTIKIGFSEHRAEAKILRNEPKLTKMYVTKGMARFLDGRYGSPDVAGLMIGYVIAGDIASIESAINRVLAVDLARPKSERLVFVADLGDRIRLHESRHPTARLLHHVIDVGRG